MIENFVCLRILIASGGAIYKSKTNLDGLMVQYVGCLVHKILITKTSSGTGVC